MKNRGDAEYVEFLEALASGSDPSTGEELPDDSMFSDPAIIRALYSLLRLLDAKVPSEDTIEDNRQSLADILKSVKLYPSAKAAAEAEFGGSFRAGSGRLSHGEWFKVTPPPVECPDCATRLGAFRAPYHTKSGATYFYWTLACPSCRRLLLPTDLPKPARAILHKVSEYRPRTVQG